MVPYSTVPNTWRDTLQVLSKWNFAGILFGGLLARIANDSLNRSPRGMKFHMRHVPVSCVMMPPCPLGVVDESDEFHQELLKDG